jgi:hypothetical protein
MTGTCWVSRETFFENHSSYYTCVKEYEVGFMGIEPMQRRHFNSLSKTRQRRTVHTIGRVGKGRERFKGQLERASK